MKKLFFLLGLAFSLFAGMAVAGQVGFSPGPGIGIGPSIAVASGPAYPLPRVVGESPEMAVVPKLSERWRTVTPLDTYMNLAPGQTLIGIDASASPVAFDTGDPRTVAIS